MKEKIYRFINRKTKESWGYSRHEFPDFTAYCLIRGDKKQSLKNRDKDWIVEKVMNKDEIKRNTLEKK